MRRKPPTKNQPTRWRSAPATPDQLKVLRRIANESGRTFSTEVTRGEASDLISERLAENPKAARAHQRAERKRRRAKQRLINPAANWRFGERQTPEQEQAEIGQARREGLEPIYAKLQSWVVARRAEEERTMRGRP
jgi:hypothetical protein